MIGLYIRRAKKNKRGQALVELSVLGAVVIMLLVWMLGLGQSISYNQALGMHSFRMAEKLARQRSQDGNMGSVSFNTISGVNPVNPMNTKAGSNDASGSGSVMWENQMFAFQPATESYDATEEDSPITYYQMGETMIKKNQAIKWPTMLVKRKPDPDTGMHTGDWYFDIFGDVINTLNQIQSGSYAEDNEYYSIESQPTWDSYKVTGEKYKVDQRIAQAGRNINFSEKSKNKVETATIFKIVPEHYIEDEWDKDDLVEKVEKAVPLSDIDGDGYKEAVVTQTQELTGEKTWQGSAN
ncbi:MAG: hypothetical protein PHU91_00745 [Candidatus Omnitrophica bacterium]|nr:hypothetical protein [Candidatus Omnitrophota bacterium]MDD5236187.1 hypothetical protein [Candidatus Omnitrophota bacterium]MDD5610826.1 hypothetical protein [Candidatus Omnitrophota bacterium]